MALYGMADNNVEIPAKRDGAIYNTFAGNQDYVIAGIGNEFAIESSTTSFVLTLGTGEGIICGRHVTEVTENGSNSMIQLTANSSGYVVIRMDLTRPAGTEAYLTTVQVLERDNLNADGTVCDLPLYGYVTGDSGVTSFIDIRDISSSGGILVNVTLLATGWGANGSADEYELRDNHISPDADITLTYPTTLSDAQFEEYQDAVIRPYGSVTSGLMVLKAVGGAPTIDLPMILLIKG